MRLDAGLERQLQRRIGFQQHAAEIFLYPRQPSRIVSAQIAAEKAGEKAKGSVLASDAMFPFHDVVEAAAACGATAIIQPGGSIRDEDSIKAADKANLAMVFTGERHFRH